jgi:Tfp pilus assembly protein PilF
MRLKSVVSARTRALLQTSVLLFLGACASTAKPARSAPSDVAIEETGAAPREKPKASPTVQAAEALLAKGDAAGARAKFEQALEENPSDARAALGLGLAWEALGNAGQAESAYRRALSLDDSLAEAHNNLALVLRDQGKDQEAIAQLERALALDPKLASAQANLALAYEDAGHADKAREAYAKAVALAPKDAMLHANFGLFLLAQSDQAGAVAELRKGLGQATGDRAALVALGNGLRRAGKPDEAVRALHGAIAADDGKPTVALLSELALAQHAAGDLPGAKASLEQALSLDPKYATAHYLLGSMLASAGDMQGAAEHYKRCLALEPRGELAERTKQKLEAAKKAGK